MTSSFARRRGSSFTIAELIGNDRDDGVDTSSHDNHNDSDDVTWRPIVRDCEVFRREACQHQLTSGAFHVYRPPSVANNNFYQACLNWMRRRGMFQRAELVNKPAIPDSHFAPGAAI